MRSLSLKIFLWFWLAVLMGTIAFLIVAFYLPSQTIMGRAAAYFSFNMASTGRLGLDLYEREGPEGMETLLEHIETISAFKLYLVSENGISLRSLDLPPGARNLTQKALSENSVQAQGWTTHPVFAHPVTSRSGEPYVILLELPSGLMKLIYQMSHAFAIRFSAALIASSLVCFIMVRYLTSPIRKLQSAVRKFSRGDLRIRVTQEIGSRKDEIADLGQDFDIMAARIETLMHAHEHLLRDMAHELRSPITRLNVALEIARKHGDQKTTGYLNRISRESQKLSDLVTQVLTLSRLENINTKLNLEPVCLEDLIQRIVNDANFEGQGNNTTVTCDIKQSVTLSADARMIHSAIENVVRNAMHYNPADSQVTITQDILIQKHKTMAIVRISDMGPGVPQEALDDLFKPFFKVSDSLTHKSAGAGVGLAIAYHAVTLHGGFIHAENRKYGGLTVEIHLPVESDCHYLE